jgi:hypothetical protein
MIKKVMIFTILMIIVTAIGQSFAPTINNHVALTQMQNSDASFALMNTYNKIRPIINLVYVFIVSYFIGNVTRDISKFTKTMSEKETTEN